MSNIPNSPLFLVSAAAFVLFLLLLWCWRSRSEYKKKSALLEELTLYNRPNPLPQVPKSRLTGPGADKEREEYVQAYLEALYHHVNALDDLMSEMELDNLETPFSRWAIEFLTDMSERGRKRLEDFLVSYSRAHDFAVQTEGERDEEELLSLAGDYGELLDRVVRYFQNAHQYHGGESTTLASELEHWRKLRGRFNQTWSEERSVGDARRR